MLFFLCYFPLIPLFGCRRSQKIEVLRMKFSIVEVVPTSDDGIFKPSPASQLPYGQTKTNNLNIFLLFYSNILYIFLCLGSFPGIIPISAFKGLHGFPINCVGKFIEQSQPLADRGEGFNIEKTWKMT